MQHQILTEGYLATPDNVGVAKLSAVRHTEGPLSTCIKSVIIEYAN